MTKERNGVRFIAHFRDAQGIVIKDRRIVRIDDVQLLEQVSRSGKFALSRERDGLFVVGVHMIILTQAVIVRLNPQLRAYRVCSKRTVRQIEWRVAAQVSQFAAIGGD